jgi:two-component system, sensor histidine kinase PdtaS
MVAAFLRRQVPGEFSALDMPAPLGDLPQGTVACLLHALPIGVAVFDRELRYRHVNHALTVIGGHSVEARLGRTVAELAPGMADLVQPVMQHLIDTRRTLTGWRLSTAQSDPSRPPREVVADFHPIVNAAGAVTGLLSLVRDVNGEQRAEQAIRASDYRLRQVLDSLFVFVGVLTPDGTLIEANRAPLQAGGLDETQVLNHKFWDTPWWGHDADVQARLRAAAEQVLGGETLRFDIVARMAGDTRMTLDFMLAPMRDDAGRVTHLIASAIDISDRKAGEDALRRSEARFRQVVEAAPDGMAMVNAQGRMVLVNAALERLFGSSRNELIGESIECLMPAAVRPGHGGWLATFFREPQARDMAARRELFALRRDGALFPVEIGLNPMDVDGEAHVLATIVDVTQRKADRALLERAVADKTALLREVHHRVKNNLQVISSLLSLQSRQLLGDARAALDESRSRVQAMALIHQLLYERDDFTSATLAPYLARLCALLADSHGQRGLVPVLVLGPGGDEVVLDVERAVPCGLLVNELVTNALKHALRDRSTGRVEVLLQAGVEGRALLRVSDDGPGLPDGVCPGSATTLGFQLVPLLAEQLAATLTVGHGPGACFDIDFPIGRLR